MGLVRARPGLAVVCSGAAPRRAGSAECDGLLVAVASVYALCDGLIFLRRQYRMPHYLAFSWPRDVVSQHSS